MKLHIFSEGSKKVSDVFDTLFEDILDYQIISPSSFMIEMWARYHNSHFDNQALNGKIFETLISILLSRQNILPTHIQAKLAFVPNVEFDFVIYTQEYGPVILSAKTSLRERYKQADLEGMMLRQVYRRSKNYLITLNEKEAHSVSQKIQKGEILGLDDVIVATHNAFDHLFEELQQLTPFHPPKIEIIKGKHILQRSL